MKKEERIQVSIEKLKEGRINIRSFLVEIGCIIGVSGERFSKNYCDCILKSHPNLGQVGVEYSEGELHVTDINAFSEYMRNVSKEEYHTALLTNNIQLWNQYHLEERERGGVVCLEFTDIGFLRGLDLSGADLQAVNLNGARLCGTKLSGADLTDAHLENADLRSADLTGAKLVRTNLSGAMIHDVAFAPQGRIKETNLYKATIIETAQGNPIFKRYVQDQDYIGAFTRRHPSLAFLWWYSSAYGQSIWRWVCWSFSLALIFGLIFSPTPNFCPE